MATNGKSETIRAILWWLTQLWCKAECELSCGARLSVNKQQRRRSHG